MWEAASFASYYKLDNLVAIIDVNRLGQSQPAALEHKVEIYQARMQAFGFNAIIVDGHNVEDICRAFYDAETCKDKPTCLIAKTLKGEWGGSEEEGDGGRGRDRMGRKGGKDGGRER